MIVVFIIVEVFGESGRFPMALAVSAASSKPTVVLKKKKATLYPREQVKIKIKSVSGIKKSKLKYFSDDEKIATVDEKGVVTAKRKGTVKIRVCKVEYIQKEVTEPTIIPTAVPTSEPTKTPTSAPTKAPTAAPTAVPETEDVTPTPEAGETTPTPEPETGEVTPTPEAGELTPTPETETGDITPTPAPEVEEKRTVLATFKLKVINHNVTVCIDPGHYRNANNSSGETSYGYSEGEINLRVGKALREELAGYGINVKMTRTSKNIKINGYKNRTLDSKYISLRGRYARGCDLFVSLHTNATSLNANNRPTSEQSIKLNKTIVFVNRKMMYSSKYMKIANNVGKNLSKVNYKEGLSTTKKFKKGSRGKAKLWNGRYNDRNGHIGAVCYYRNSRGEDYFGVLRGSNAVGVPGMLIEHGYHTIPELRRAAMEGDLVEKWAHADAYGIAKGFGLAK